MMMSKKLIITGIKSCSECPLFIGEYGECWHKEIGKKYVTDKEFETMPDWCPLPDEEPEQYFVPEWFAKECIIDYDRPLTYVRVTHIPSGTLQFQHEQSGSKLRDGQAQRVNTRLCYELYCAERGEPPESQP